MSLVHMGCTLKQRADVDAYVKYQDSVLDVERGKLETALSPILRLICGTRSLGVSGILPERTYCFFKNKLDKVLAYYPDVPRCSDTCHSLDGSLRKSNSLCDHYRNEQTKAKVNGITKV